MKLLAPFGFFGAGNIGDESTLQGFARLISSYGNGFHVWVASRNPDHTKKVEPAFKYYKSGGNDLRGILASFRSRAQIIIGGTPIMDVLGKWPLSELAPLISSAHRRQQPVVFVGSGVEELKRDESREVITNLIGPRVKHWTVRSDRDKHRLIDYGISAERITVGADLAWSLDSVSDRFGKELFRQLGVNTDEYLVGVNLTNEKFCINQRPDLFQKVAASLDAIIEQRNARVLFFANEVREGESFDKTAALKTRALMRHQDKVTLMPNDYRTPQQTLSLIDSCDLIVSMRYHFCLFASLQEVPFIALMRSDKVADLCWDLNWPYGISLNDLDSDALLEMASEIYGDESLRSTLSQKVRLMAGRAMKNRAALDALSN
jgi:polysaccharide pyruvyl transferase WcaK-like protein